MNTIHFRKAWVALALGIMLWVPMGCNKALDIPQRSTLDLSKSFETEEGVKLNTQGLYFYLNRGSAYSCDFQMVSDLLASDISAPANAYLLWDGTFATYRDAAAKSMLAQASVSARIWANAYTGINQANLVLKYANKISNATERNTALGEAYLTRAVLHFELVRFFGRDYLNGTPASDLGVPIMTSAVEATGDITTPPRATVAAVYAQVIADLQQAKTLLDPAANPLAVNFFNERAIQATASAFLARVYLQQGNYAAARDEADLVIQSGNYSLAITRTDPFLTEGNDENILEMQHNATNNVNNGNDGLATFYCTRTAIGGNGGGGRGGTSRGADASTSSGWVISTYPGADARLNWYYGTGTPRYVGKWQPVQPARNYSTIRLAEMYLIRAEGIFEAGAGATGSTALADVNTIRTQAGVAALAGPITLNDILQERQRELAFEGQYLWDIKRRNQSIGVGGISGATANSNALLLPIPQREIDTNPSLIQNPGY